MAPHPTVFCFISLLLCLLRGIYAGDTTYVQATDSNGLTVLVPDDRKPALYTQDFGDCAGNSLINVSRFDAAWYKDNMTILFHLEGSTNVANDSLMMFIGVYAYGEQRFDLTFDPCNAQIYSLCPLNRSVPIEASGVIPISQNDVANIPPIALTIPDFEGQAILRVFSNSTKAEIGCYSATITNGGSFSQPAAVGTILGLFTLIALVASFATAVYGDHIPTMRTHYAHSLSIFVVFAVFHHIFFTGALSVNWPSVLVAWWSNFAWSGGMIFSEHMQNSLNKLVGSNFGNLTMVGSAGAGAASDGIAGGYQIASIYKRSASHIYRRWTGSVEEVTSLLRQRSLESHIAKRSATSSNGVDSPWYGKPTRPGLPIPGNYSGLAGTLSEEKIPASNAFMTGFLWLLILVILLMAAVALFKYVLDCMFRAGRLRTNRLDGFRKDWKKYCVQVALRTIFIAFFMLLYLIFFQFTFKKTGGATAIAALVFLGVFIGMSYLAFAALRDRLKYGHYELRQDRLHIERSQLGGVVPWIGFTLESHRAESASKRVSLFSFNIKSVTFIQGDTQQFPIHEDEDYIRRHGWLAARYRRTRWWFFAAWMFYEFIRACFFGGAAGHPMVQVFGLLVVESIALFAIIKARPFEGSRLNALMVYLLGFSKVLTVALSAAFDPQFGLTRITTTVIGVVIIVIQGFLTIALLIAIVAGAITTYLSITRDHEDFRPRHWTKMREHYLAHMEKVAPDLPPAVARPPSPTEAPVTPYFDIKSVRRQTKIQDDDEENFPGSLHDLGSQTSLPLPPTARQSRRGSSANFEGSNSNLPFGARSVHRASWNAKELEGWSAPDAARQSRHMQAAAGLYQSRPTSRHASRQVSRQTSRENLAASNPNTQQPLSPVPQTPGRGAAFLNVQRSRPGTAGDGVHDAQATVDPQDMITELPRRFS